MPRPYAPHLHSLALLLPLGWGVACGGDSAASTSSGSSAAGPTLAGTSTVGRSASPDGDRVRVAPPPNRFVLALASPGGDPTGVFPGAEAVAARMGWTVELHRTARGPVALVPGPPDAAGAPSLRGVSCAVLERGSDATRVLGHWRGPAETADLERFCRRAVALAPAPARPVATDPDVLHPGSHSPSAQYPRAQYPSAQYPSALRTGLRWQLLGMNGLARNSFATAVARTPSSAALASLAMARLALEAGEVRSAETWLDRVLKAPVRPGAADALAARIRLAQRRPDEAVAALAHTDGSPGAAAEIARARSAALHHAGRREAALAALTPLLLDPRGDGPHHVAALIDFLHVLDPDHGHEH